MTAPDRPPVPASAGVEAPSAAVPASRFSTTRRVEFADTDVGGIVHFSRFFVYMETAEHLFLESLGLSVHRREGTGTVSWPRVAASCEYLKPARFGDVVEIHLAVARKGRRSLRYRFEFRRGGDLLARGEAASVCCALDGAGGLTSIPLPAEFAERIAEAGDGRS